ncbi:hypothetical protein TKK_0008134 [Trichogramma kaykai]
MSLQNDVLNIICGLFSNTRLSKSDVDEIINEFSTFISHKYNTLLRDTIQSALSNAVSKEISNEIDSIFNRFKNPFDFVETPDKRENMLIKYELYTPPEELKIGTKSCTKVDGTILQHQEKVVKIVHIPLKSSLKQLLQGSLWKNQLKKTDKKQLYLPLFFYSDDVEMGNGMGAHAGKNKVGANYVLIPCLPPSYASKISSIILSDLYFSNHRKLYGNKAIFKYTIEELNDLRENGIEVQVENKCYKVYFITSIVLGDNLGLNGMLGFIESFHSTTFCRICYSYPEIIPRMIRENSKFLRTIDNYENDVTCIENFRSGIKERCVFNELKDFHVITNMYVDILHDVYEGICSRTMCKIILKLVLEDKLFTIDFLNFRLSSIKFGFESSNIPLGINLEYLKNNGRMKMSGSEILFFTRYFCIIVGCKVPSGNQAWTL